MVLFLTRRADQTRDADHDTSAFMVVEGDSVTTLDLSGKEVDYHRFERLTIHGLTVTADGECIYLILSHVCVCCILFTVI